jgi:4-amino-4-deoxy-L-arabinose transferase-like glycosyltransferase
MTDTPPGTTLESEATSAPASAAAGTTEDRPKQPFDRSFAGALALAAIAGVMLRIAVVVVSRWDVRLGQDDAAFYAAQGRLIRHGHWFVDPFAYLYTNGRMIRASASHPPAFPLLMAGADAIGLGGVNGMRLVCCVVGGVGIVLVGLLGREIAGRRVGMIAAAIAAVYPIWWLSDSLILAEVLYLPFVAGTLLLAYRLWKRPSAGRAVALGVVGGLAALTRSEGILLLVLVAGAVLLLRPRLARIRRIQLMALTLLVAAATLSPWIIYNFTRFDRTVFLSTNDGATLADTNCPAAYSGKYLGLYVFGCHVPRVNERGGDESEQSSRLADVGLRYAEHHAGRVPVVVAARVGRVWGLFRPVQTIDADAFGRWSHGTSEFMLAGYWIVAAGGLVGFYVLRRRRVPISPMIAALAAVTLTAAVTYGIIRFRVPGDVVFVTLTAVTVDALIARDFPVRARLEPAEEWIAT